MPKNPQHCLLHVPGHVRANSSYLEIADFLEEQVVTGTLPANSRLPNTPELLDLFDVSRDTLQRALSRLVRRGLITRSPRRGTHVTAYAGATNVGLVVGSDPFSRDRAFYRELLGAFMAEGRQMNYRIKSYLFLGESSFLSSVRDLERDIADGQLRCLVSVCLSGLLGHWTEDQQHLPCLLPPDGDHEEQVRLGLEHLLARGRQRPAILSLIAADDREREYTQKVIQEERRGAARAWQAAGMDGEPPRPIHAGHDSASAYACVGAMFAGADRPDSILVNHDLNTQGVLYALLNLGLRIPADVAVVTHENRGVEHFSPVPLTRLVCDPRDYAVATLEYLRRHGRTLHPGRQQVPGLIEPKLVVGAST